MFISYKKLEKVVNLQFTKLGKAIKAARFKWL